MADFCHTAYENAKNRKRRLGIIKLVDYSLQCLQTTSLVDPHAQKSYRSGDLWSTQPDLKYLEEVDE